jgi:hypothetical protein
MIRVGEEGLTAMSGVTYAFLRNSLKMIAETPK